MPQWKWTIYETNNVDTKLYQYLKNCGQMKANIVQAIEIFYLPYALKYSKAPPLEIQKAFQKSIDLLQSQNIVKEDERLDFESVPRLPDDDDNEDWDALPGSEAKIDFGLG
jgi:hypothetical protein